MTVMPKNIAQAFKPGNMQTPLDGSQAFAVDFNFDASGALEGDMLPAMASGDLDIVQSIFIDNSQNSADFTIIFPGGGINGQRIVAQPFSQGYYPVTVPLGIVRFTAASNPNAKVPCIFYSVPMPYFVWGPTPGVFIVPSLTNLAVNLALVNGDNEIIPAVAAKAINVYRLLFSVDAACNLKFTDGPGGALLAGPFFMSPGGSITLQPSGIAWWGGSAAKNLTLNSSAVANLGGIIGYTQA